MQIQLNNIQLLEFYKATYPDAEIIFEGRNLNEKKDFTQPIPPVIEPETAVIEEEKIEKYINNKKSK